MKPHEGKLKLVGFLALNCLWGNNSSSTCNSHTFCTFTIYDTGAFGFYYILLS